MSKSWFLILALFLEWLVLWRFLYSSGVPYEIFGSVFVSNLLSAVVGIGLGFIVSNAAAVYVFGLWINGFLKPEYRSSINLLFTFFICLTVSIIVEYVINQRRLKNIARRKVFIGTLLANMASAITGIVIFEDWHYLFAFKS